MVARCGSSRQAILKYIMANVNVGKEAKPMNAHLNIALSAGVKNKTLKQSKRTGYSGSFRIGEVKAAQKHTNATKVAKPKAPIQRKKRTRRNQQQRRQLAKRSQQQQQNMPQPSTQRLSHPRIRQQLNQRQSKTQKQKRSYFPTGVTCNRGCFRPTKAVLRATQSVQK